MRRQGPACPRHTILHPDLFCGRTPSNVWVIINDDYRKRMCVQPLDSDQTSFAGDKNRVAAVAVVLRLQR
jgi:hypothetical protein